MKRVPEELDVSGLSDDVDHFVEGDGGVGEVGVVGLGVFEEEVDGPP